MSPDEIATSVTLDILDRFSEKKFDTEEIARSLDELGPYQNVFIQEMDVMNILLTEIVRSLKELQLGFAGELTMSDAMESLKTALFLDRIPPTWQKRAWPSMRPLSSWLNDFNLRLAQLEEWQTNPAEIPKVTWLSGLVNPQSFLTAVCQVTAKAQKWELDKLQTWTDVTKKMLIDDVDRSSPDGAFVIGLNVQGARWDLVNGMLERSKPKEMFCKMPIINVRAMMSDRVDVSQGIYVCPTYKTVFRGPTFVFCAQLKTKANAGKWVLAGVALIMDVQ